MSLVPARLSESLILQTYPFQEADLIVSFFTRDHGKLRGVARIGSTCPRQVGKAELRIIRQSRAVVETGTDE